MFCSFFLILYLLIILFVIFIFIIIKLHKIKNFVKAFTHSVIRSSLLD